MDSLLSALLVLSEKGAQIARVFRQHGDLLVEEKTGNDKNQRFSADYKSIADVLIQETFKYFLSNQFPKISDFIFGEESNKFTNSLGETLTLTLGPTLQDTAHMLSWLLPDHTLSLTIARIIHDVEGTIEVNIKEREKLEKCYFNESELGIWIDPLDGTNEYVKGVSGRHDDNGIFSHGLQCVTILVGVFNRTTGEPIMGVVNQPFHVIDEKGEWLGRTVWGVATKDVKIAEIPSLTLKSAPTSIRTRTLCVISNSEDRGIIDKLQSASINVLPVAGCGYKLLCVIDRLADAFILSQPSSYRWDTCGSQAVLMAIGGNIVSFKTKQPLLYNELISDEKRERGIEQWVNREGMIACTKTECDMYVLLTNII